MINNLKNIFNLSEKPPNALSDKNSGTNRFTGRTSDDSDVSSEHAQNSEEDVDLNQSQREDGAATYERTIKSQLDILNGVPQRLLSAEKQVGGGNNKSTADNSVTSSRNQFKYHKYPAVSSFAGASTCRTSRAACA